MTAFMLGIMIKHKLIFIKQVLNFHRGRSLLVALAILTCRVLHLNGLFHHATHQRQRQVAALHLMEELMASEIHFPFSPLSIYIQMMMQSKYYMLSIIMQFTMSL